MRSGLKYLPARISAIGRAFTLSPDALVITTVAGRTGPRILYANAAFERLCGYAVEEIIGHSPRMLQGPDTDARAVRTLGDAVRKSEAATTELLNYHKNGTPYLVEIAITPLSNREGRITHFMAVEREVTARKLTGPAQQGFADGALIPGLDSSLVVDAQNQVFAANAGFLAAFGWREGDLLGSPASLIVVEEHSRRMRTSAERMEVRKHIRVRIRTGAGRFQSALADISPFIVAGRPLCQLIAIRAVLPTGPDEGDVAPAMPNPCAARHMSAPARFVTADGTPAPTDRYPESALLTTLTPREAEVLSMLPAGISNQDIADRLGLAEVTVKLHLRSVYRKLGVVGRPAAIRIWRQAQRQGLR